MLERSQSISVEKISIYKPYDLVYRVGSIYGNSWKRKIGRVVLVVGYDEKRQRECDKGDKERRLRKE